MRREGGGAHGENSGAFAPQLRFCIGCAVTFALYRLPLAVVWYPTVLAFLAGCVVMVIDYRRVRAKHEELSRLIGRSCEGIDALPPAENVTEADYRALIEALRDENAALAARYSPRPGREQRCVWICASGS